ncbi:methionine--tRNA ligase [candidate division KSB1 bacterium]|nr:methionine--tRNA ligase [candidate division KSB1 bacterium]
MKSADQKSYQRLLVTSALPYANGPIHLGHLAGAYLPADVYVRYQRARKRDVIFICGTDEHGVPISIIAEKAGITPQQLVDRFWADHFDTFSRFGISFDNFSRTSAAIHHQTAKEFFKVIYDKNYLVERTIQQFYCTSCNRFLADRFVEGTCPHCKQAGARGDQCETCGSSLEQTELIDPYCKVCGRTPVLRETRHLFIKLNEFQQKLETWLKGKKHWKKNVLKYCRGWFKKGLGERAVTRDLSWGIPVPVEGYEDKVIYVWFEAPIGYISATKEWADKIGQPDRWQDYWCRDDTQLVHFIGKDNIVFHAVIWPAMLMGHGQFVLPAEIPANEFLNIHGEKLSTSRNYAVWLGEYLEQFPPDPLRYYLSVNAPETKDADFTWEEFQQRNNSELADILGNFVNRTLTFARKQYAGRVPPCHDLDALDESMLADLKQAPEKIGQLFEQFELRKAAYALIDVARTANKYFNDQEPWRSVRENPQKGQTTIHICIQVVKTLTVLMAPILPFSAEKVWKMLGLADDVHEQPWDGCGERPLSAGHELGLEEILFKKIEDKQVQPEIDRLRSILAEDKGQTMSSGENQKRKQAPGIVYDDFARVELRVARVVSAARVEKTDKLMQLKIDLGGEERQIVAGIAQHYQPDELIGRQIVVVANLQPAIVRGIESKGMLLAAEDADGKLALLTLDRPAADGAKIK